MLKVYCFTSHFLRGNYSKPNREKNNWPHVELDVYSVRSLKQLSTSTILWHGIQPLKQLSTSTILWHAIQPLKQLSTSTILWHAIQPLKQLSTPKPYIVMIRVTRQINCLIAQAPGGHTPPPTWSELFNDWDPHP